MPATDLAKAIRCKQISPVDLVDAVLARVEALNPRLNAFLTIDAEGARAAAQRAEAAVMGQERLGLLHGLPVSIKDLEPTAGLRCTYGSKFYAQNIAEMDGMVSSRVKAAGGILLGKTNTPHYGHKDMTDNLLGPPCRNPWNLARTPGGSSGGAAAAVAAGLGPLAHGTDGAGSIRIPAALSGVFGFKPSFGRIPVWPNVDIWTARTHNGPLTRTVADAALFLQATAGSDPRDPTSISTPPDDYLAAVAHPFDALRGLRVAWSVDFGYAAVDPEVRQLTSAAARRFADLGCHVEAVNPGWPDPRELAGLAWYVSFAARMGDKYAAQPDWFESSLAVMMEAGLRATGVEHVRTSLGRTEFYQAALRFFGQYDLLLTPQMPVAAWPVEAAPATIEGKVTLNMFDRLSFTFPFNLTGQPAASVPCGFTQEGLPVALQMVGGWQADTLVLQAAAAFEQLQPWAHHWPVL
jgi:Asp-tRNA(Asn)/Glu-tRNA(Gln) amidotransferase A subunit family amidase